MSILLVVQLQKKINRNQQQTNLVGMHLKDAEGASVMPAASLMYWQVSLKGWLNK